MGVVSFDQAAFLLRYPEFSSVAASLAACFSEAQVYCNNTDASPVTDFSVGGLRSTYLNMMTAHIAALNFGTNGNAPSQAAGRITSASEGSVSVSMDYGQVSSNKAWFVQTKYGAAFLQATSSYRTDRYFTSE
jgi:hypothetical protein